MDLPDARVTLRVVPDQTALDLIARLSQDELANVIYQLGDERRSRRIARCIKQALEAGELVTTLDLRRAVVRAVGPRRVGKIDPATRTFQALRIRVNRELEGLGQALEAAKDDERRFAWLRELLDRQREVTDPHEFLDAVEVGAVPVGGDPGPVHDHLADPGGLDEGQDGGGRDPLSFRSAAGECRGVGCPADGREREQERGDDRSHGRAFCPSSSREGQFSSPPPP